MRTAEIRTKFIEFFQNKQHTFVPSASTIPTGDKTILFTIAGMTQFKACLTGEEQRPYKRATNAQKCIRAADLDDVGKDGRHLTMFEMLGSWSFGDYYKQDAIAWAYEFVRDELKFDLSRFWATVHTSDDEAFEIWKNLGVSTERIVRLGDKDNFWAMGPTGPCGPCSELYLDQGPSCGRCGEAGFDCKSGPGCDCDRYLEFWNLVFMQYDRQDDGTLKELPMKSVDTGSGLERVAALSQGKHSAFEIDIFAPLREAILKQARLDGQKDPLSAAQKECVYVLCDHMRMLCFTLADGALFSNEGRGYVMRRVLRRAVRYAHKLVPPSENEATKPSSFLAPLVRTVCASMGDFYKELPAHQAQIEKAITEEELRFRTTLDSGLIKFQSLAARAQKDGVFQGEDIFILHDSFGFPSDLTRILCEEIGLKCDLAGFEKYMKEQKERSRSLAKFYKFEHDDSPWSVLHEADQTADTSFEGYALQASLTWEGKEYYQKEIAVNHIKKYRILKDPTLAELVIAHTPFYPEGGGQVSDTGIFILKTPKQDIVFDVIDVRKTPAHIVHVLRSEEMSSLNALREPHTTLCAGVNKEQRGHTAKNHTATHLLHAALRAILGDHVRQAGSLVNAQGLRFDFSHPKAVSAEDIGRIEQWVNNIVLKNLTVTHHANISLEQAKSQGAMAMFDEKYDDVVRMLQIGEVSLELCGGTHVHATGEIGLFKIVSEGSVTSGVRRIEALSGLESLHYVQKMKEHVDHIALEMKCAPADVLARINALKDTQKKLSEQIESLQMRLVNAALEDVLKNAHTLPDGTRVVIHHSDSNNAAELERMADRLKEIPQTLAILSTRMEEKIQIVCSIHSQNVKKELPFHAGLLIKKICELCGGKGGGRPDFAKGSCPDGEAFQRFSRDPFAFLGL